MILCWKFFTINTTTHRSAYIHTYHISLHFTPLSHCISHLYLIAFHTSISLHFTPLSHCISHLYLIAFHTSISLHFTPLSHCISHLASLTYPNMCKTSQHCSHPPNILLFSLQPPDCCTNTTKENKLAYGWSMYCTNV